MDDKEPNVELVAEPKVNTRFGFGVERKVQSSTTVKVGATVTIAALFYILFFAKTPEKSEKEHSGIKTPDSSQLKTDTKFDSYSEASESQKLKGETKKHNAGAPLRLPGLQKIDRKNSGIIPPGSTVKAILLTGASNGAVKAEVKESLQVQGETLIPEGATLLGSGQSGEDRLMVHFTQIIYKDGSFDSIQAEAADAEDKIAGLHGSKVGSYAMKYGAAIGLNFVGGMTEALQDREAVGQQVVTTPNAKNALLNGSSKATLELASDTMSQIKSKPPVIEVPVGEEILVIFGSNH